MYDQLGNKLKNAINRVIDAEKEGSWTGAKLAEEAAQLKLELREAKDELNSEIQRIKNVQDERLQKIFQYLVSNSEFKQDLMSGKVNLQNWGMKTEIREKSAVAFFSDNDAEISVSI